MNVAVIPLKFGSTRLKLKNILPVRGGPPSFVLTANTVSRAADKTILVYEEGYRPFVMRSALNSEILLYEAPYPIHGEGSTVADVVNYGLERVDIRGMNTLLVVYPTAFNLREVDIEDVLQQDYKSYSVMLNGQDAGCVYKMSMDGWRRHGNYVDEESRLIYLGDHLVDINTEEDFIFAERQRACVDVGL